MVNDQPTNKDLHQGLVDIMEKLKGMEKRLQKIEANTLPIRTGKSAYDKS